MITRSSTTVADCRYRYFETVNKGNTSISHQGQRFQYANLVGHTGPLPGWRQKISNGDNATTYLAGTEHRFESTPCTLKYGVFDSNPLLFSRDIVFDGVLFSVGLPTYTGSGSLPQKADNLALTRFYSNLARESSAFKGMVFAGELRESLKMIRHPAQALRRGVDSYLSVLRRNGPRFGNSQRQSFVRRTWLEYSYGWRPLINDLDGAVAEFYKSQWARPIFKMVRGSAELKEAQTPTFLDLNGGYGFRIRAMQQQEVSASCKYYGILESRGTGAPMNHSFGFSPWEFIPTLWELIPYSFLVDYFVNVGDIVSSWSYRFIQPRWLARGTRTSQRIFINNAWLDSSAAGGGVYKSYGSGDPGKSSLEYASVVRDPAVPLLLPSLEVKAPGMQSLKWVNIAALTANLGDTRRALKGPR